MVLYKVPLKQVIQGGWLLIEDLRNVARLNTIQSKHA